MADPPRNHGRGRASPWPSPEVGITGVDPLLAPGLQVVRSRHPLDRGQADPYLLLRRQLPDAGGKVTAQSQPCWAGRSPALAVTGARAPSGKQTAGSFGVGQAEALLGLAAAPLPTEDSDRASGPDRSRPPRSRTGVGTTVPRARSGEPRARVVSSAGAPSASPSRPRNSQWRRS